MNYKETLWNILEKYDGFLKNTKFCDSLSKFIQGTENSEDILNIYVSLSEIEKSDKLKIDQTIGGKLDSFLFSI